MSTVLKAELSFLYHTKEKNNYRKTCNTHTTPISREKEKTKAPHNSQDFFKKELKTLNYGTL